MIAGLKPYAEYKDSGVPWLGAIPAHWGVRRIKTLLREVDRRSATGAETLLSLRMQAGLVDHHAQGGKPIPPSALVGYKHVMPGEIVMNRMRAAIGLFATARREGLVSPDYAVFRPVQDINTDYAVMLFRAPAMASVFRTESTGLGTGESGFLRLYSDQFTRLQVPAPQIEEQAAMLRYLDWANGRLERAIRAKRKVIALLTEQRRVIVDGGVTGSQLQDGRPYRTGNRWFPELPKGWKAVSLRRVINSAIDGPHFSPTYTDRGIPFLSSRNIKADRWSLDDVKFISETDYREFSRRVKPKVGDVLYTKGGTTGVARAVDLPFPFQVWVHVAV